MSIDGMEQDLLAAYRELRDGLVDMIEGGRLSPDAIPDDDLWLSCALEDLADDEARLREARAAEGED